MIQIHPYKLGSAGAIALRDWLEANGQHTIISSRMKMKGRLLVGWGAKEFNFDHTGSKVVNHPNDTRELTCKRKFFDAVSKAGAGDYIPPYTVDPAVARGWGGPVVARATTTGASGVGLSIHEEGEELLKVPLYTKYEKKTHEYRLHMFRGRDGSFVGQIQRKVFVKDGEKEPKDWRVRNHENGFIFQTEEACPEAVSCAATEVFNCFPKITFIALDVIYHKPTSRALVLEGNTAPGLEGGRLPLYGEFFKKLHNEYKRGVR